MSNEHSDTKLASILFCSACVVLFSVFPGQAAYAGFDSLERDSLSALFPGSGFESGGLGQAYCRVDEKTAVSEKNIAVVRADIDGERGKEVLVGYSLLKNYEPESDNFELAVPYAAVLKCGHGHNCNVLAGPLSLSGEGRVVGIDNASPGKVEAMGDIGLVRFLSGAAPIKTVTSVVVLKSDQGKTSLVQALQVVTDDPEDSKRKGEIKMLDLDKDGIAELVYHAKRFNILDPYSGDAGAVLDKVFQLNKEKMEYEYVMTIQCSSVLEGDRGETWTHAPVKMFDHDDATAWCEGTKEFGIAEFIKVDFPKKTEITTIEMMPGWAKSPKTFLSHNQVKTFMVESESEKKFGYTFPESIQETQTIELLRPVRSNWVRIWIQEVFSARTDQTCISTLVLE